VSIVIVDYGLGNIGSIMNMFNHLGKDVVFSSNHEVISTATKLVLPGVGAYDSGMKHLNESGIVPLVLDKVKNEKTPLLGICLGMQLLLQGSEEGQLPGLGLIPGFCRKFSPSELKLKVPHMGWNEVLARDSSSLFESIDKNPRFYFVHSYYADVNQANVMGTTVYGQKFVSAVCHENIFGVQFHPEKSHKFGMQLIKNFIGL
jgi:imidazole glycerol-phosphate synthase subunit HisH